MEDFQDSSDGVTPSEKLLASLCQKTFLRLWSYANPFKEDGKEFCDLIAVFDDHVFIFFDRESRKFDGATKDIFVTWQRWKKEAVDKQIKTAIGAERYLKRDGKLFLDQKCAKPFPLSIPKNAIIHKIIVAHGAAEACKAFSDQNVYGSLGVSYVDSPEDDTYPFMVSLARGERIHLLDSHNLELVFSELDTFYDFSTYVQEKERALEQYRSLSYCGEEDLLAHYFLNYDESANKYRIGTEDNSVTGLHIGEGEWHDFSKSAPYSRRKEANEDSYLWDRLIQRTCDNYLAGTSGGNSDLLSGKSAIKEMAREPRFSRRALCKNMMEKVDRFPTNTRTDGLSRHMSTMPSFYKDRMIVFLQVQLNDKIDYETQYRQARRHMLEVACGVTKNRFPHLKKIIGIALEPPKLTRSVSEDFVLLECEDWPDQTRDFYDTENENLRFYKTPELKHQFHRNTDFPSTSAKVLEPVKVGRNAPCPCGSGKKYKKCCIRFAK